MARVCNRTSLSRAGRRALTCTDLACLALFLAGSPWLSVRRGPAQIVTKLRQSGGLRCLDYCRGSRALGVSAGQVADFARGEKRGVGAQLDRSIRVGQDKSERGLAPAPAAEPRAFLRRLYLDLTGLPPTPDECAAFLADFRRSPDAIEKARRQPARPPRLR